MSVEGKPNHGPRGEISPEERAVLERRSSELGRKLEEARDVAEPGRKSKGGTNAEKQGAAMGRAMRLSAELVGGIVVGGAIGWYLDAWLGTKPWLLILFFLLGAASGMMNLIREAMREKTPPLPSVRDERDENN